jgi:hypothetical protein
MVARKQISLEHNAEIIEELLSTGAKVPETVSLRKFIAINFQAFTDSGKSIREIYDFLKGKKIDVGGFHVFRSLYSKVKKSQNMKFAFPVRDLSEHRALEPGKTQKILQDGGEADVNKPRQSKHTPVLPPVFLPGGLEAIIDPETGAKSFEF